MLQIITWCISAATLKKLHTIQMCRRSFGSLYVVEKYDTRMDLLLAHDLFENLFAVFLKKLQTIYA
jgi:hypothetical protein